MSVFEDFRSFHYSDSPLVLVNAWDAGSARLAEHAGAKAVATSSGAIAWSMGRPDGEFVCWNRTIHRVREIATSVSVPVTVDIESGFSSDLAGLRENISQLVELGVVGINIEDVVNGSLLDAEELRERIRVVREAAPDLFINVRTDTFLTAISTSAAVIEETLHRGKAYEEAGGDGLFVPGLTDDEIIRRIVDEVGIPVNIMTDPHGLDPDHLWELGVRRVSYGTSPAEIAYGAYAQLANQMIARQSERAASSHFGYMDFQAIFAAE